MNCQSFAVKENNGNIWNYDATPDNVIKFLEEKFEGKKGRMGKMGKMGKTRIVKPELWMRNTPEEELGLLEWLEEEHYFMTRRMGGCVRDQVSTAEVNAHHEHKEELMEYLNKIK